MELGIAILGFFAVCFGVGCIALAIKVLKLQTTKTKLEGLNREIYSEKNTAEIDKKEAQVALVEMTMLRDEVVDKLNKTVNQKKSSEVRLGKIGENLAPFTNGWPWDSNNFRFLGSPVDGVQFTDDEIIFVEIKTGKSRLSRYQAKCRDLIKDNKVRFVSFRIGEDGVEIK